MSADLLASLDSFYQGEGQQQRRDGFASDVGVKQHEQQLSLEQAQAPYNQQEDDFDDFGDFESAGSVAHDPNVLGSDCNVPSESYHDDNVHRRSQQTTRPKPVRASSTAILRGIFDPDNAAELAAPGSSAKESTRDESILFDVDDVSEDGFGEYEGEQTFEHHPRPSESVQVSFKPRELPKPIYPTRRQQQQQQQSLLDLDFDAMGETTGESRTNVRSLQPIARASASTSSVSLEQKPQQLAQAFTQEDAWTSGDAWEPVEPALRLAGNDRDTWTEFTDASTSASASNSEHAPRQQATNTNEPPLSLPTLLSPRASSDSVAPTNIPPPALILPLFPPVFQMAKASLMDPLGHSAREPGQYNAILRDARTHDFAREYLSVATTCAHIIAGRKARWKRDTILSQSMRIGPASRSGKSGGMKLAGIDKGETAKEEREVAEVVRCWRAQVGQLRGIVTRLGDIASIPDLSETLPVRLANQSEGGISSTKPCALCGLKRNERVPKADVRVEDNFGEWWAEHWGHVSCMRFWNTHKERLLASR